MTTPLETEYREIHLSKGMVARVDEQDFAWLSQYKWHATKSYKQWYAKTYINGAGVYMHRLILGLQRGDTRRADHRNPLETLDNRRGNLRVATQAENLWNAGLRKDNRSGYKGVAWHSRDKCWQAYITARGRNVWLGSFKTIEEAVSARSAALPLYHNQYARMR